MLYKSNTINLYATKTCLFLEFLCDIGFNLINIRLENNNKSVAIMTGWGNNKENDL